MPLHASILAASQEISATCVQKKGAYSIQKNIAERKTFLFKTKLSYNATIRIDDTKKELTFSESLTESGFGIGGGSTDNVGMGWKTESFSTNATERSGVIEEQSRAFGNKYEYSFDFAAFRNRVKALAAQERYRFIS